MGKKANAKKLLRKLVKEKEEQEKTKFFGKSKKKEKSEPKVKNQNKKIQFFGGFLILIMTVLLIWIAIFLFEKAFQAKPIAKFLPADKTILTLEFNIDKNNFQNIKTFELLKNHPEFSQKNIIKFLEKSLNFNYEKDSFSWLGRNLGIALIEVNGREGLINELYFLELINNKKAEEYFAQKSDIIYYPEYKIYKLKNSKETLETRGLKPPQFLFFYDNYLIASSNKKVLDSLIESINTDKGKLYNSSRYRRLDDNLPFQEISYIYLDYEKIIKNYIEYLPLITKNVSSIKEMKPLISILSEEAISIVAQDNKFLVKTFLSLNNNKENQELSLKSKYEADLLKYVPKDVIAIWGGVNLSSTIEEFSKNIDKNLVLNLIDSKLKNFFGNKVTFNENISSLLDDEFVFTINKIKNDYNYNYNLLVSMKEGDKQKKQIEDLIKSFIKNTAAFTTEIVSHTMDDGSSYNEIIAVPDEIIKDQTSYKGINVFQISPEESDLKISYAYVENTAIISSSIVVVKDTIDLLKEQGEDFKSSEKFTEFIEPIIKNSDQVNYINLEKLDMLFPLKEFSSGKNYFNDGIITVNLFTIR